MKSLYDTSKDWVHYLTRPFNLFGASIWHEWYSSKLVKSIFGFNMPDALFIEERAGILRHYKIKEQLDRLIAGINHLIYNKADYCVQLFEKGIALNKKAEEILKIGPAHFKDLQSAVDFIIETAVYATMLPHLVGYQNKGNAILNNKMFSLIKKLREVSHYPRLLREIIEPMAEARLEKLGINNPKQVLKFVTFSELNKGSTHKINEMRNLSEKSNRFVYQILKGRETIYYTADVLKIINKIEKRDIASKKQVIKGQAAYPGKVQARAKLVLTNDPKKVVFRRGDVIVGVHLSPALAPLIKKCSAIVTDEGGITSHAAIISRELNIPCIIGTKVATFLIKDGDNIEVDAEKGIVRVLKK